MTRKTTRPVGPTIDRSPVPPHSATRRAEDARPRRWPGHNTPLFARVTREGFLRLRSARVSGRGSRERVHVRVASRALSARARTPHFSRAFAGHLSERAREVRATRRSETRVKRARGLERVFVRSFTGETRVERARARGERGESSVGGVQWFRGGPS